MKASSVKTPQVKAAKAASKVVSKVAKVAQVAKVATKKAPAAAKKAAPVVAKKTPVAKKVPGPVAKKAASAKKVSSKTATKKAVMPPAAKPAEKPARRPKQRDVRNRVIALLETGPMTTPTLMKSGKFSQSALYLNLKALRDSGTIQSHRTGKSVTISLTGKATPVTVAPAPKPVAKAVSKRKPKVAPAPKPEPIEGELIAAQPKPSADMVPAVSVPRHLHEALSAVRYRLTPIERAQEKLMVLDQLASTMPEAVAEVLRSLMEDIGKLGG